MTNQEKARFRALRAALQQPTPTCEIDAHQWTPDAGLNSRIVRCLLNEGCRTLDDAAAVLRLPTLPPNFGTKCWLVVHDNLQALGKL